MSDIIGLPASALSSLKAELRAASWFAALGEPLTDGDRIDATAYATALGGPDVTIDVARGWPEAEHFLKAPDWSPHWWDREEALRLDLLKRAETRHSERALLTGLTELTTEIGEVVHGKAATAAARMGDAARASIHVAAGAASQAAYQLAVARLAGEPASAFESKFRLFAAGRWPLGIVGPRLILF